MAHYRLEEIAEGVLAAMVASDDRGGLSTVPQGRIAADPELAARLAEEIVERRHYTLSTVSVIELEELGVRRLLAQ